jgi:hypothetical protein
LRRSLMRRRRLRSLQRRLMRFRSCCFRSFESRHFVSFRFTWNMLFHASHATCVYAFIHARNDARFVRESFAILNYQTSLNKCVIRIMFACVVRVVFVFICSLRSLYVVCIMFDKHTSHVHVFTERENRWYDACDTIQKTCLYHEILILKHANVTRMMHVWWHITFMCAYELIIMHMHAWYA